MKRLLVVLTLGCAGALALFGWQIHREGTFLLPVGSCAKFLGRTILVTGHHLGGGPYSDNPTTYEYQFLDGPPLPMVTAQSTHYGLREKLGARGENQVRQFNQLAEPIPCAEHVQEQIRAAEAAEAEEVAKKAAHRRKQEEWLEDERRAYRTITEMCGDVLPAWRGAHAAVISPSNKQLAKCLEKWKAQAEGKSGVPNPR